MIETLELEERDVSELENGVSSNYECEDCGHIGDTYKQSERVVNSNAPNKGWKVLPESQELTEDDDVAVLCPKCLSWFYFFKKEKSDEIHFCK